MSFFFHHFFSHSCFFAASFVQNPHLKCEFCNSLGWRLEWFIKDFFPSLSDSIKINKILKFDKMTSIFLHRSMLFRFCFLPIFKQRADLFWHYDSAFEKPFVRFDWWTVENCLSDTLRSLDFKWQNFSIFDSHELKWNAVYKSSTISFFSIQFT